MSNFACMKKDITEYFYAFDSLQKVYEVASILVEDWGLEYDIRDEFRGVDKLGRYESMVNLFDSPEEKASFLANKGLDCMELVKMFDDLIEHCYVVSKNHKYSFADILCEATNYVEERNKPRYYDDTDECNHQFRSMMDDNDAWCNIE